MEVNPILSLDDIRELRETIDSSLLKRSNEIIEKIVSKHTKTQKAWSLLCDNPSLTAQWDMSDYIAVTKMRYNAHGDIHAKIVTSNALKMLDLLLEAGVQPDIMKTSQETIKYGNHVESGDMDDAYLVVLLSGLLHDIGNQVNRSNHNLSSFVLAVPILDKVLTQIYSDERRRSIVRAFILHCIYTHMEDIPSYTLEASLVKVADGTDMTKGRGRTPFDMGNLNIHCVSAMSISDVEIVKGSDKPISILIDMTNSAGVFQVGEVLHKKLASGVAGEYIEISARTIPEEPSLDERIVYKITIKQDQFVHEK